MIKISARGILLDIEGTTSSISFVYEVMFPYVRQHLRSFLEQHWGSEPVEHSLELLATDQGCLSRNAWLDNLPTQAQLNLVEQAVIELMDRDVKSTGLKQLQGQVWRSGFETGQLVSHLFEDVGDCLRQWSAAGIDVRIYSSGSVAAQRLFFKYSIAGDLSRNLKGHYDTTIGAKQSAESYQKIAIDFNLAPQQIVFISDVGNELNAAREAGLQSLLSIRAGNVPVADEHGFPIINSFREIVFI